LEAAIGKKEISFDITGKLFGKESRQKEKENDKN
jgi:hypothetical protein